MNQISQNQLLEQINSLKQKIDDEITQQKQFLHQTRSIIYSGKNKDQNGQEIPNPSILSYTKWIRHDTGLEQIMQVGGTNGLWQSLTYPGEYVNIDYNQGVPYITERKDQYKNFYTNFDYRFYNVPETMYTITDQQIQYFFNIKLSQLNKYNIDDSEFNILYGINKDKLIVQMNNEIYETVKHRVDNIFSYITILTDYDDWSQQGRDLSKFESPETKLTIKTKDKLYEILQMTQIITQLIELRQDNINAKFKVSIQQQIGSINILQEALQDVRIIKRPNDNIYLSPNGKFKNIQIEDSTNIFLFGNQNISLKGCSDIMLMESIDQQKIDLVNVNNFYCMKNVCGYQGQLLFYNDGERDDSQDTSQDNLQDTLGNLITQPDQRDLITQPAYGDTLTNLITQPAQRDLITQPDQGDLVTQPAQQDTLHSFHSLHSPRSPSTVPFFFIENDSFCSSSFQFHQIQQSHIYIGPNSFNFSSGNIQFLTSAQIITDLSNGKYQTDGIQDRIDSVSIDLSTDRSIDQPLGNVCNNSYISIQNSFTNGFLQLFSKCCNNGYLITGVNSFNDGVLSFYPSDFLNQKNIQKLICPQDIIYFYTQQQFRDIEILQGTKYIIQDSSFYEIYDQINNMTKSFGYDNGPFNLLQILLVLREKQYLMTYEPGMQRLQWDIDNVQASQYPSKWMGYYLRDQGRQLLDNWGNLFLRDQQINRLRLQYRSNPAYTGDYFPLKDNPYQLILQEDGSYVINVNLTLLTQQEDFDITYLQLSIAGAAGAGGIALLVISKLQINGKDVSYYQPTYNISISGMSDGVAGSVASCVSLNFLDNSSRYIYLHETIPITSFNFSFLRPTEGKPNLKQIYIKNDLIKKIEKPVDYLFSGASQFDSGQFVRNLNKYSKGCFKNTLLTLNSNDKDGITSVSEIDDECFFGVKYLGDGYDSVEFTQVNSLGDRCFAYDVQHSASPPLLYQLSFPQLVITSGVGTFMNNNFLKSFSSETLLSYPPQMFSGCQNLLNVSGPVKILNDRTFSGTIQLQSVQTDQCQQIGTYCFSGSGIQDLVYPILTEVPAGAFQQCVNLKSLSLPLVDKVSDYMIDGCFNIDSLTLVNNVVSFGDYSLRGCKKLKYNIPSSSCRNIGQGSFMQSGVDSVILSNVISVGEGAFSESDVVNVNINFSETGTTILQASTFSRCLKLETVSLSNCNGIKERAFFECNKLREFVGTVGLIGDRAFERCQLQYISVEQFSYQTRSVFQNQILLDEDKVMTIDYNGTNYQSGLENISRDNNYDEKVKVVRIRCKTETAKSSIEEQKDQQYELYQNVQVIIQ